MKPYYRIIRPIHHGYYGQDHLLHKKYCKERPQLVHSYFIIQQDFKTLMDYIEICDDNKSTYSHRIFELFLRVCTEFENNCKGIIKDNSYEKTGNLNITDYFLINKASKLNEYTIRLNNWSPEPLEFSPFAEWNQEVYTPLSWYQDYNSVKHNRSEQFRKANLENLTKAIGALYVVIASQFGRNAFSQFQATMMSFSAPDGFQSVQDSIFNIKFPSTWTDEDKIEDVKDILETQDEVFHKYNFN